MWQSEKEGQGWSLVGVREFFLSRLQLELRSTIPVVLTYVRQKGTKQTNTQRGVAVEALIRRVAAEVRGGMRINLGQTGW